MAERGKNGQWLPDTGSPNPAGRPSLPEDIKESKRLNQIELERILNDFLQMDRDQLSRIKNDPNASMLQLIVHSIITNAINRGDHTRFEFILNRLLGKMKESFVIEVDKSNENIRAMGKRSLMDPKILNAIEIVEGATVIDSDRSSD